MPPPHLDVVARISSACERADASSSVGMNISTSAGLRYHLLHAHTWGTRARAVASPTSERVSSGNPPQYTNVPLEIAAICGPKGCHSVSMTVLTCTAGGMSGRWRSALERTRG